MNKSYKFRIYPNKEQEILFDKTFGVEYQQPDTYIYSKFINRSGGK